MTVRRFRLFSLPAFILALFVGVASGQTFTGVIDDKYPVSMSLSLTGDGVTGDYQYLRIGRSLALKGVVEPAASDGARMLRLREYDGRGDVTGTFEGSLSRDGGTFTGVFSQPNRKKSATFILENADFIAAAAKLTREQAERLRNLKWRIALPTYIPPGFTLQTFAVDDETQEFTLIYQDLARRAEFTFALGVEGLGDGIFQNEDAATARRGEVPARNPLFGTLSIRFLTLTTNREVTVETMLDWAALKAAGRDASGLAENYRLDGVGLAPAETARIVRSLKLFK
jgi:hypothetical protein